MDQYFHWDSNHFITAKNNVFSTLAFRAKVVCFNQRTLYQGMDHIRKGFLACNFPPLALNSLQPNLTTNTTTTTHKQSLMFPYTEGIWGKVQEDLQWPGHPGAPQRQQHHQNSSHGFQGKRQQVPKMWCNIQVQVPTHQHYPEDHIGEYGRFFGERLKKHLMASSPIHHHSHTAGHLVNPKCFTIMDRESQGVTRNIKEAMYIHVNNPSLNRNLESINFHIYGMKY